MSEIVLQDLDRCRYLVEMDVTCNDVRHTTWEPYRLCCIYFSGRVLRLLTTACSSTCGRKPYPRPRPRLKINLPQFENEHRSCTSHHTHPVLHQRLDLRVRTNELYGTALATVVFLAGVRGPTVRFSSTTFSMKSG